MDDLSPDELRRYSRHLVLPNVGVAGQRKLKGSSALIVGAGGLGSPVALYLAAAGVGRLGIVDDDRVDATNLQRQIIHDTAAVGSAKSASASARIAALNPQVKVDAHQTRLTAANARQLLGTYDLVLDCSDNFPTRYLINDAAILERRPLVFGSVFRFEGQLAVFAPEGKPCYRCLYPHPPASGTIPDCEEGGVFGVLPGIIGALQATEAIKLLLGIGTSMVGRLLLYDALSLRFREIGLRADPDCDTCGLNPSLLELTGPVVACEMTTGDQMTEITASELNQRLQQGEKLQVVDVRQPHEWEAGHLSAAQHIPLGELADRAAELDSDETTVVYCRTGGRSSRAAALLREKGFGHVLNLTGGITGWSRDIDPSIKVI